MKYGIIILSFILFGCYNQKKATTQFGKAVITYPIIGASYCANEFPVKDSTITDTLITTDTLYVEPLPADTVMIQDFDTVRIYITKTLPAKIITNTVQIRDTIYQTNTAALKLCEINRNQLTDLLIKTTAERDDFKAKAKKRGAIMWSTFGLIFLILGLTFYLKSKKVLP